jgi:hypothetical protein
MTWRSAAVLTTLVLAQAIPSAKTIEDRRYGFRVDLPGVVSAKIDESDGKGPLAWRAYTSSSPGARSNTGFTAAVKVFDTQSNDARALLGAGENDASQSLGITLIGRVDGTFGAAKLPSVTLSFQSGRDGAADMVRATVLLVVKGRRFYEVTFSANGADEQAAVRKAFFASFALLP